MYRHADILNAGGIKAAVVQGRSRFRPTWFNNTTPIVNPPLSLAPADVLAIPEIFGSRIGTVAPGIRRVVLNQNAYLSFHGIDERLGSGHPYRGPDVIGAITVSEDSTQYLRHAFPGLQVQRVHYSIDPQVFFGDADERPRQIAYMPRKRPAEAEQVLGILGSRGLLEGWSIIPIDGRTEGETAAILRRTTLFLSFSEHEGFGLPPAEAMACGCFVIGYDGFAGREFLRQPYAQPVPDGDVIAFARAVEAFLLSYDERRAEVRRASAEASRFILAAYGVRQERDDVLHAFRTALARSSAAAPGAWLRTGDAYVEGRRPPTGVRSVVEPPARRLLGQVRLAAGRGRRVT